MAAVGSSSSAVVWTDPGCIGLQIAHGWRLASTGAGTTKLAATDVPGGARPGRITVRAALARGARTLERKSSTRRAVGLLQSKDRRGRPNKTRTRWTLRQSCSKGEGRARVDSRGVCEECHAGGQWIVSLARLSMRHSHSRVVQDCYGFLSG